METRISRFVEKIIESGWLAALIVVPLLFNVYDERVFEEDKGPLLRSIAVVMVALGLVWLIERGREALEIDEDTPRPVWRIPLILPWALMIVVYGYTTIISIAPEISFWGAYIRRQGTYANLSYMLIFILIVLVLRRRPQVNRLVTVVLLASVPASLYAVVQHYGLDPLPWGGDVVSRVSSVAGNPIFIAAYLIMVVPLTLARLIEHFGRLLQEPAEDEPEPNYLPPSLLAGAYLFLLIIQLLAILFSQSRGPFLGLAAGLFFFVVVLGLQRRMQWLSVGSVGLAMAGIIFLIVFNLPNSPLAPLRDEPYIGRMGRIFEMEGGTGRVRVLIWDGVTDMLADNPVRAVVGFGPETLYLAYPQYYPPELAQLEARNASPDRSHNETFDALAMRGIIGFGVQLFLFGAFFYYILRWLGIIETQRHRYAFLGLWLFGGAAGWLLPYLIQGHFTLSGVGLPAGIAAGMIFYMMGYALTHLDAPEVEHPNALLLVALLAAVMAHFVEIHFGIAIAVTKLHFWVFAGLAVVLGMPLVRSEEETAVPRQRRRRRAARRRGEIARGTTVLTPTLLGLSIMSGLVLAVLVFDFVTPNFPFSGAEKWTVPWLFAGTWLFGGLAVTSEAAYERDDRGGWGARWGVYALISLVIGGIYFLLHLGWVQRQPAVSGNIMPQELLGMVDHIANTVTLFYIWVFLLIGVAAVVLYTWQRAYVPQRLSSSGALAWSYPLLLIATIPVIVATNLNVVRADIFSKQGQAYERAQQWEAARLLYEHALDLQPEQDRYFLNLGRVYLNMAQTVSGDQQQRERYLREAEAVLTQARDTNPLNMDHRRNLGSLHRAWAAMAQDQGERKRHLALAEQYFAEAVELSPNNAAVWNDWALIALDRGDEEAALERLEHSLALDPEYEATYTLLGSYYLEAEQWAKARDIYTQAVELKPKNVQAWSGLAFAYTRLGNLEGAIRANERALSLQPNDFVSHRNLALLYRDAGNLPKAMEHAERALELAPESDRAALQNFVAQLRQQLDQTGS